MAKGERLDALVVALGLFESRQVARTAIMEGAVLVDGEKVTKPGHQVKNDARVEVIESFQRRRYVSRGGLKLEKALHEFNVEVAGRICLDVGASTGGFTDCLLKHGALTVYAVDVGYGQLDWSLRQDERVVVVERTNARSLTPELLYKDRQERADLSVIDVSFISLSKVIPAVVSCLSPDCELICLIKPQFEAGREEVGKGGVVKRKETHESVLESVKRALSAHGLNLSAITFSPIKGPKGNIEFLAHFTTESVTELVDLSETVSRAHEELSKIQETE